MPIIEPVIRPPAEAESVLIQITTGCSANKCTFCGAYRGKRFRVKDMREIEDDIRRAADRYPHARKVFLMDGDALVVGNKSLLPILDLINEVFPQLTRIAAYANGYNITVRGNDELRALYERKLRLIYIGLESGSQRVLDGCRKKSSADEMVTAVTRAAACGIKSSVIVLLGLGGKQYSREHIEGTIAALNMMQPRYLSFLSVMLIPGTPLYQERREGRFEELTSHELLDELALIVEGLELKKTVFRSNHASNYLPLEGRLPHDKERLLATLRDARDGKISLKPEFFRGL